MLLAFGFYDIVTLAALVFIALGFGVLVLLLLGLPGKIARQRNHPEADAVNLMGWLGFLGGVPWINALIWSIKPTDVIDIRRFPEEEREELRQQAEKYKAESAKKSKKDEGDDKGDAESAAPR